MFSLFSFKTHSHYGDTHKIIITDKHHVQDAGTLSRDGNNLTEEIIL